MGVLSVYPSGRTASSPATIASRRRRYSARTGTSFASRSLWVSQSTAASWSIVDVCSDVPCFVVASVSSTSCGPRIHPIRRPGASTFDSVPRYSDLCRSRGSALIGVIVHSS